MSLLNNLKTKRKNLTHTLTMIRNPDGSLYQEDLYSGSREIVSIGNGFVIDNKPNLIVTDVIQGLLMGSQDVANCESILENHLIKNIISLGVEVQKFEGIKYMFIEVLDLPEFNITNVFEQCFSVIDEVRKNDNVVFVHCNAGVSRSATIVIGYIMREFKMNFKTAFEHVRIKRPSIRPNEGFIKHLLDYEKYLAKMNY